MSGLEQEAPGARRLYLSVFSHFTKPFREIWRSRIERRSSAAFCPGLVELALAAHHAAARKTARRRRARAAQRSSSLKSPLLCTLPAPAEQHMGLTDGTTGCNGTHTGSSTTPTMQHVDPRRCSPRSCHSPGRPSPSLRMAAELLAPPKTYSDDSWTTGAKLRPLKSEAPSENCVKRPSPRRPFSGVGLMKSQTQAKGWGKNWG